MKTTILMSSTSSRGTFDTSVNIKAGNEILNTIFVDRLIKLSFIIPPCFNRYPKAIIKNTGLTRPRISIKFCKSGFMN